ncbi:tagaturonate reductase [Membranicola marinus]|uniref:Tagaturonate reductase n=1 Tax=Membranihabitans marinus TaxID=1227546 RepID=A0A953HT40_9BACT|nr:tagaturonate reductase [Membranihabitans marinus]MBY5957850.1 tagaturonate reductase [Membranihabitans marinus]
MKKLTRKKTRLTKIPPERILQFGGGNFLRGFVDWMVDVLNKENIFNGSVVIVKPTPSGDYDELKAQDGLFHVVLDGVKDGKQIHQIDLVQSVSRTIQPYTHWKDFLQTARDPGFRFIVSNTTEAGIAFSKDDQFNDKAPSEFPAKLTRWLYERFTFFGGSPRRGCLILPCELIEQNGSTLQEVVLRYADHWQLGRKFIEWIQDHNYFYNTLVDRIVSGFPTDRAEEIKKSIGYDDKLIVAGEYYHSWIISGNPVLQKEWKLGNAGLNVQFVSNITDYRNLKVRVLNGAHTALVPVGFLAGHKTVDEAVGDEKIEDYLMELLTREVKPTLDFLSTTEVDTFINAVLDRFRNPVLAHQLLDISLNSISKFQARLLPTIEDYIDHTDDLPRRIIFALAAWILFYRGRFHGMDIPLKDDEKHVQFASAIWMAYDEDKIGLITLVDQFLAKFGVNRKLGPYEDIRSLLADDIKSIHKSGVLESLPE